MSILPIKFSELDIKPTLDGNEKLVGFDNTGNIAVTTDSIVDKAIVDTAEYVDERIDNISFPVSSVNGKQGVVVLSKTDVGLANVDNTSDVNKPVSTAQATANAVIQADVDAHEANTANPHSVTKTQVGLGNVDNTSDASKPISSATQTALNAKENTITAGTTAQYYRGDKSFQTLDKTAIGLANVDNTSDASKPISAATQAGLDGKQPIMVATIGTAPATYITDGVNDEVQFNQAITALNAAGGGKLYLKDQSYHVGSSPISLKNNVWIQGAGRAVTTIYGDSTLGTNAVMLGSGTSFGAPLIDSMVSDLTIDGSSMPTTPVSTFRKGIDVIWTLRMRVFNVRIYHTPATGFGPDCNIDLQIDNCIFDQCGVSASNPGFNGLGIGTGGYANESCLVTNCIARNCLNNGFLLEYVGGGNVSKDFQFSNCYAYANKRGYRVSGAAGVTYTNCKAINSTNEGFYTQLFGTGNPTPYNVKVIACDAYGNGGSGIFFVEQEPGQINHIVEACHSYSNTGYGIVAGSSQLQVRSNVVYLNTKTGIFIHTYSATTQREVQVSGNICYNNGTGGTPAYQDGIRLWGELGTLDGAYIANNRCFDNQGSPTQQYGITLKDTVINAKVRDNDVRGNVSGGILDDRTTPTDASVSFKNNIGWNPEGFYRQGNVSGATTFDRINGSTISATLTGSLTTTLANGKALNDELSLVLTQPSPGGSTMTVPSNMKLARGGVLNLSTTANATDTIHLKWDGTNWREVGRAIYDMTIDAVGAGAILIDSNRKRPFIYSDFLAAGTNIVDPFVAVTIASGTITTPTIAMTPQHPGVVRIVSSTSANSGGFVGTNASQIMLGGGEIFEAVFQLGTLTTTIAWLGFLDTGGAAAEATDGVYIGIDGSGVITGKTSSNSVRSSTSTTYSATTATWYRVRITVSSTSSVTFAVYNDAGTLLWTDTLTTNIPSTVGRETGAGSIAYNSGTTAVTMLNVDYMAVAWSTDRTR